MPLLLIIFGLLVSAFLVAETRHHHLLALVIKAFASFTFIILFAYEALVMWSPLHGGHLTFVLLGLVAGLIGDIVLALRPLRPHDENHAIILAGIISFFIGHLFYLMALLELSSWNGWNILVSVIFTVIVIVISYLQHFSMGVTRFPSYLYSFIIVLVISQSVTYGWSTGFSTHAMGWIIATSIFLISDLVLTAIYFMGKRSPLWVIFNIVFYYSAQALLALSVGWLMI